jgi:uncharacterized membrane protein
MTNGEDHSAQAGTLSGVQPPNGGRARPIALGVVLVAVTLALALFIRPGSEGSNLAEFLGRFHILALHVPIGALLLVVSAEALALSPKLRPRIDPAIGLALAFLASTGVAAFGLGLLLAHGGGYPAKLIALHRGFTLAGIVASAAAFLVWSLRAPQGGRTLYRLALLATAGLFTAGAHVGGSLTHGEDFLTRYAPPFVQRLLGAKAAPAPEASGAASAGAEPRIYADVLAPALRARCVDCHGPDKAKGGLRVDSLAALRKGGEHGPAIKDGRGDASPLVERMLLPAGHDDRMPPDGKAGLADGEIALLRWWIDRGASEELRVRDTLPPDAARGLLATLTTLTTGTGATQRAAGSAPARASVTASASVSSSASAPSKAAQASPRTVYGAVIAPILSARCEGCHGAAKVKGQLRVDSLAALLAGGRGGVAVVARDPSRGSLLARTRLALEDDKHMPPTGEPQPAALELEAVSWWLEHGADASTLVEELPPKLQSLRPPAPRPRTPAPAASSASNAMVAAAPPRTPRYDGAPRKLAFYADVVAPVLDRRCGNCHTGGLASAGLRTDDVEAMIAKRVIVPGKDAESPLVRRTLLPDGDRDHMPPMTKPQPTPGEIEVIRTWIAGGARREGASDEVDARTLPADVVPAPKGAPAATGGASATNDPWETKASPAASARPSSAASEAAPPRAAPTHGGCASCTANGRDDRETRWLATLASAAVALAWMARRRRR